MNGIEVKDFLNFSYLFSLEAAANEENLAFLVRRSNFETNKYETDLFTIATANNAIRRQTHLGDIASFLWLLSGEILFSSASCDKAFAKKREAGENWTSYFTLNIKSGEIAKAFDIPLAVSRIVQISDSVFAMTAPVNALKEDPAFQTDEARTKSAKERKDNADFEELNEIPFWSNGKGFTSDVRNKLYIYNSKNNVFTAVTDPAENVYNFFASANRILFVSHTYTGKMGRASAVREYDIAKGELATIIGQENLYISAAFYLNDSICFTATDGAKYGPGQNNVFYRAGEDGSYSVFADTDLSLHNSIGTDSRQGANMETRVKDGRFYFLSTANIHSHLLAMSPDGTLETVIGLDGSVDSYAFAKGCIYEIAFRDDSLAEIYQYGADGKEVRLSNLNREALEGKTVQTPEHFTFTSGSGGKLDGFVIPPAGYEKGKKYPAILNIHGGPKSTYGTIYVHEMQVWANRGYFVLYTNPHGSDGRGNEFADLRGKYGTIDYSDIMDFLDSALDQYPDIDQSRTGVTGGSYGGFMTNWIIGHTDRFAAAASQRSISNWFSKAYTTDIGYYHNADQLQTTAWEEGGADIFWEKSPLAYADKCTTPTLFIHAQEDYRCWLAEGLQMFTALKYHDIDAKFVLFRGENHELSRSGKPKHRVKRLQEITDWFEKYLK